MGVNGRFSDHERLHARLIALREELRGEGDVTIQAATSGEVPEKPDEDQAPLTEMGQVIASSRNRARTARLREIEQALQRLADDPEEFGVCEDCDDEIPPRRMELMPWARLCIGCQEKREDDGGGSRKHVTDYR